MSDISPTHVCKKICMYFSGGSITKYNHKNISGQIWQQEFRSHATFKYDISYFSTTHIKLQQLVSKHFYETRIQNGLYNQSLICYLFTAHLNLLGGRNIFGGANEFFQLR